MDDKDEWWESGKSVLAARHDDDDDLIKIIPQKKEAEDTPHKLLRTRTMLMA